MMDTEPGCLCRLAVPVKAKYGDESTFFDLDVSIYLLLFILMLVCYDQNIESAILPSNGTINKAASTH